MATVEEMLWRIDATTEGLRRELKRMENAADASRSKLELLMNRANRGFSNLSKVLSRSVIPAIVGLGSLTGIRAMISDVANLADTADKLGITAERLQELRFAAEQNGVAARTLDMAYQRFTRRLGEAQQGTGELLGTLKQYGIALTDMNGGLRSSNEVFGDLSEAIKNAGSSQEQLRIAFKAFDSEGAALVNLMRLGADGIDDFASEAQRLGIVLEEDLAKKAQKFDSEINKMLATIATKGKSVLLDFITSIRDAFNDDGPIFEWGDALEASRQKVALLRGELEKLDGNFGRAVTRRKGDLRAAIGVEEAKDAELQLRRVYERLETARGKLATGGSGQKTVRSQIERLKAEAESLTGVSARQKKLAAQSGTGGFELQEIKTPKQIKAAETAGKKLVAIEERLQGQLTGLRKSGADLVRAEYRQLISDIDELVKSGAADTDLADRARDLAGEVRDAQIESIKKRQTKAVEGSVEAVRRENAELAQMVVAMQQGEAAIAALSDGMELEKAVREHVNAAKKEGLDLTEAEIEAYRRHVSEGQRLRKSIDDIGEAQRRSAELSREFGSAYVSAMEDVIWNSKSATESVRGLIKEIARIGVRKAFLNPAGDAFGSFLSKIPGMFKGGGGVNPSDAGLFVDTPTISFRDGGVMTGAGAVPLRQYAGGGIANSAQLALFGEGSRPEAYVPLPDGRTIPVTMTGKGGGNVVFNVRVFNNAGGTQARADMRREGGGFSLDVIVEQIEGEMARNIARGEGFAPVIEQRYALNPAAGSYR